MKKIALSVVAAFALVGLVMGANALAVKAKDAPASVTIDGCKAKKSAVTMDHKKHASEACDKCHHTQKGLKAGAADEVKKCSECHKTAQGKLGTCSDMSTSKNPFHVACITCHKAKAGAAPTKCGDCHK